MAPQRCYPMLGFKAISACVFSRSLTVAVLYRARKQAAPEYQCRKCCKIFGNAEVTLSGIELANKIKEGQFDTSEITRPRARILQVWEAVLAA